MSTTSTGPTEQAILTLSSSIHAAAAHAVNEAAFPVFRQATIVKLVKEHIYRVSIDDRLLDIPVYGDCSFERSEKVWIISPQNSKNLANTFILGKAINVNGDSPDHRTLMQLVDEVNKKLNKSAVVQETGQSTTNVMSQKAVTDALDVLRASASDGTVKTIISGTSVLPVTSEGTVTIPIATTEHTGVVLASNNKENEVAVGSTGIMEVKSLDVMRVNQHADNVLILDGGNAHGT